jgi:hypothetical protein
MYFPDLGTITQIASGPHVRAVGWLDEAHAFSTGSVDTSVVARIQAFADEWGASVEALGWPVAAGPHTCNLCGRYRASGNFGVPCGDVLFVCPEMIAHYVAEHEYRPPDQFITAITRSDLPGSKGYAVSVCTFRSE